MQREMRPLILLLYFIAQDVYAQQGDGCGRIMGSLSDDFFSALRQVESEGDICKMSTEKLGPYQISEKYYDEAVEVNDQLKLGGMMY